MVPEGVREFAAEPFVFVPRISTTEWIDGEGYRLACGASVWMNTVDYIRTTEAALPAAVDHVRRELVRRDRSWAQWMIAPATEPSNAEECLLALGLTPATGVPYEHRSALLALVEEPPPGPSDVVARPIESADVDAAVAVQMEAFGESRFDEVPIRAAAWRRTAAGGVVESYGVWIDGQLSAIARAAFAPRGAFLMGGCVLPAFRGRGAYRALVRARWDAAVRRGTPALVTHAGKMSRPILERLGFEDVGELRVLVDEGPWE
jgi:GNAT superfamily N-acetyltransferase